MANELVKRLIEANENGSLMGSDIFYKAAERIEALEKETCVLTHSQSEESKYKKYLDIIISCMKPVPSNKGYFISELLLHSKDEYGVISKLLRDNRRPSDRRDKQRRD